MVVARLDELAPTHRAVLEYAAVLGDEFRVATVVRRRRHRGRGRRRPRRGVGAAPAQRARRLGRQRPALRQPAGAAVHLRSHASRARRRDPPRGGRRAGRDLRHRRRSLRPRLRQPTTTRSAPGTRPSTSRCAPPPRPLTRGDLDLAHAAAAQADAAARELAALGQAGAPAAVARLERVAGTLATALGDPVGGAARLTRAIALAPTRELAIDAQIELARNLAARGELVAGDAVAERAAAAAAAGDRGRHLLAARSRPPIIRGRAGLVTLDGLDALVAECAAESDRRGPELLARALLMRGWRHQKAGRFADAETDGRRARDLARANGLLEIELRVVASLSAIRSEAGDVAGSQRSPSRRCDGAPARRSPPRGHRAGQPRRGLRPRAAIPARPGSCSTTRCGSSSRSAIARARATVGSTSGERCSRGGASTTRSRC
jgi:hypothetical protein